MRVKVSNTFANKERVEELVRYAFDTINHSHVEIHVTARAPVVWWQNVYDDGSVTTWPRKKDSVAAQLKWGGVVNKVLRIRPGTSGMAYHGIPDIANVLPSTKWLVTIKASVDSYGELHGEGELVFVAAHEARHVEDFKRGVFGGPGIEKRANAWGERVRRDWCQANTSTASLS